MRTDCLICGVDFSVVPEAICILCDSRGLGLCTECFQYSRTKRYCAACMNNISSQEEEIVEDSDPGEYSEEEEEYDYDEV